MILYKEDLLKYMISGAVHLSKKDYGFYSNLWHIIQDGRTITSNQTKLFDKLINKYQRQLKKNKKDIGQLLDLTWQTTVVETRQDFLDAHLSLDDNILSIRLPFNSKFIQDFRRIETQAFSWDKQKRVYEAKYSTHALKIAFYMLGKHFPTIVFCPNVKKILSEISVFDNIKYWNPTYKKVYNNFIIVATNPYVDQAISQITLDDSPKTLHELSLCGVVIDEDIITDEYRKFAASVEYEADIDNFEQICEWIKLLELDTVITSRDIIYNKQVSNELKSKLQDAGISYLSSVHGYDKECVLLKTPSSYTKHTYNDNVRKTIILKNSRAIKIT